jgi:hypothetical protein
MGVEGNRGGIGLDNNIEHVMQMLPLSRIDLKRVNVLCCNPPLLKTCSRGNMPQRAGFVQEYEAHVPIAPEWSVPQWLEWSP